MLIYAQLGTFIYYLWLPFFFYISPGKPVFNVTTLWIVGCSLRQGLQNEDLQKVCIKGSKSLRESRLADLAGPHLNVR